MIPSRIRNAIGNISQPLKLWKTFAGVVADSLFLDQ